MVSREGLSRALGLKSVARAGWVREGVDGPESVAAHSWGMAFLATQLCPENLDLAAVLEMCALHDLAEVVTGDITPEDEIPDQEKFRLEIDAIEKMEISGSSRARFLEYASQSSEEARFVKMLDKLDMALQSSIYSTDGLELSHFEVHARSLVLDWGLSHLFEPNRQTRRSTK